jgi:hypothetical protein
MQLSRRQFVQGSISAAVAAATAFTESPWLLRRTDQIRVGIAGLGASGRTHLALFAAIPCVQIMTLCDPDPGRLEVALRLCEAKSRNKIALYNSLDRLLDDPEIDAVSVTGPSPDLPELFRRTAASRKALLIDAPSRPVAWPEARNAVQTAAKSQTVIRAYISAYVDPGGFPASNSESFAVLLGSPLSFTLLARCLDSNSSAPLAPALACLQLVSAHAAPNGWSAAFDRQPVPTVSGNPAQRTLTLGETSVAIHSLLGTNAAPATLELRGSRGRAVFATFRRPPIQASAQTFLSFLSNYREPRRDQNVQLERTLIASGVATLIKGTVV